jgi:hypothetical protein
LEPNSLSNAVAVHENATPIDISSPIYAMDGLSGIKAITLHVNSISGGKITKSSRRKE